MKTVDGKAGLLRDNGNLEEAEKLYEKVVDGMRSCQGFYHLVAGRENEQWGVSLRVTWVVRMLHMLRQR